MMVVMFLNDGNLPPVQGSVVQGNSPGVCLDFTDRHGSELTLHLDTPEDLIRLGEKIVAEGMKLKRAAALPPTLDEALADPQAFVDGMECTSATHSELPEDLKPKRKPIWDLFEQGFKPRCADESLEYTRWEMAGGKVLAAKEIVGCFQAGQTSSGQVLS
jgi:hypothetical protein